MADELIDTIKNLDITDEKIDQVSKQWIILKHKYRSTKDSEIRQDIKKKWEKLQKKMDVLEKKRRKILEKKNEIEFKRKWKGWKTSK